MLKKIIMVLLGVSFVSAFAGTCAAAGFDAAKYVVDDGLLFAVDAKGGMEQVEGAEVVEAQTEGGVIYWLAADPNADGSNENMYKGWKSGIYFFGSDGKFISCLEKEDAGTCYVWFSPDGKQFALDSGTYVDRDYELYAFDGLALKKSFRGIALAWLGPLRFAYSAIDTAKGRRHEDADIPGWMSVVVCDTSDDSSVTALEATNTEDFMMDAVDLDTDELIVTKFSVENEGDWGDDEKTSVENIRIPIPAAG